MWEIFLKAIEKDGLFIKVVCLYSIDRKVLFLYLIYKKYGKIEYFKLEMPRHSTQNIGFQVSSKRSLVYCILQLIRMPILKRKCVTNLTLLYNVGHGSSSILSYSLVWSVRFVLVVSWWTQCASVILIPTTHIILNIRKMRGLVFVERYKWEKVDVSIIQMELRISFKKISKIIL